MNRDVLWAVVAATACLTVAACSEPVEPADGVDAAAVVAPADAGAVSPGADAAAVVVAPDAGAGVVPPDAGAVSAPDAGSGSCVETTPASFSFFVMSLEAVKEFSGSEEGFGGNLGGLAGADAYCQRAAQKAGAARNLVSCKTWRAFLSVTDDGTGKAVNAIDRVGNGPWHDVHGHLLASDRAGLLQLRPAGDTAVVWTSGYQQWPFNQCLTTELGNCNHSYGDTHDTLTGSNRQGQLYSADKKYTCNDWTSADVNVSLPIGHSWPRRLDGTDPGEAHWLQAHTNCTSGPPGGGGGGSCNGCGKNINITDSMEAGVGGDGGYGAWYCFAVP